MRCRYITATLGKELTEEACDLRKRHRAVPAFAVTFRAWDSVSRTYESPVGTERLGSGHSDETIDPGEELAEHLAIHQSGITALSVGIAASCKATG